MEYRGGRYAGDFEIMDAYPKSFFRNSRLKQHSGKCFVIMPFAAKFNQIYRTIRNTLVAPGLDFACSRADDIRRGGQILEDVFREIAQSEIIIADLSDHNPNVFYELGIVQMVKDVKKVILITDTKVPFNVANFRVITYKRSTAGVRRFKDQLISAVIEADKFGFELRGSPGKYKLPHKVLGPDQAAYDFEITKCTYVQNAVKIELDVTRHVTGENPKMISRISRALSPGRRIELKGMRRDLQLEHGTDNFARFVFQRRA